MTPEGTRQKPPSKPFIQQTLMRTRRLWPQVRARELCDCDTHWTVRWRVSPPRSPQF